MPRSGRDDIHWSYWLARAEQQLGNKSHAKALFQQASYRPMFEDRRARMVGDMVTIQIVENITASQKSSSTVDRSSDVSGGITALPFVGSTFTDKTKLAANYMQRKNEAAVPAQRKSTLWSLGVSHPMSTAVTLEAQYYNFDYQDSTDGAQMLVLRGTYAFSKRTAAYTTLGFMRNDGQARFSPSVGASNTALAPLAGRNQTGLMVGLRHAF